MTAVADARRSTEGRRGEMTWTQHRTMSQNSQPATQPDLEALKARQQAAWSSGDYAIVGTTLQIVGEELCEALDVRAGQRVLDVAAGNGNVALAAARRWCDVVATDYVPALLERARERAAAERLDIEFREADAEALPFPRRELRRRGVDVRGDVHPRPGDRGGRDDPRLKRGGKIGLANWTPEGFIGQVFKTIGRTCRRPPGARSPALWGTRARIARTVRDPRGRRSRRRSGTSSFAIARRRIGSRCSGATTARSSRPSPRWSRHRARRSSAICWR